MTDELLPSPDDFGADLEAFQQVARAFQRLDPAGRQRLLKTVATFFKLDIAFAGRESPAFTGRMTAYGEPSETGPIGGFSEDRTPTPKDFLREKKARTDVERVAVLAYYLTHYRGVPHFKTIDLSQLNTEAAQIKFSNAAQAVDNATKAGLLVPAVKGTKQLSANGELFVQALPDRDAARAAIADARPKRKKRPQGAGNNSTINDGDT